jgi:HlyD family secretion protein
MDRVLKSGFVTRERAVAAAVVATLAALSTLLYARYGLTRSLTANANRLTITSASRSLLQEYIPVTGNIVPARTVYLDAIEGGQVTQVLVEAGQRVEEGQPLLELKNADLQLRLVEAESRLTDQLNNLNTNRLQVEQTRLQLQERLIGIAQQIVTLERDIARNEELLKNGIVSAKTVEDMHSSLESLRSVQATVLEAQRLNRAMQTSQTAQIQSSVDAMSANLKVARENLRNLVIRAPIAGQLTVFDAAVGEAKSRGQRIGQIDGTAGFKVSATVDEFYLGRVTVGQSASVRIGDAEYALTVTKVYPSVRDRAFQIDAQFSGTPPESLRRGQTLRMNLEIGGETETLVVESGPWIDHTGGTWAFVLSPDGATAHRRVIRTGRRNPESVEVLSGVREGERLIASSYAHLGDFDRIDIQDKE